MVNKLYKKKAIVVLSILAAWLVVSVIYPSPEVVNSLEKGNFVAPVYNAEKNEVYYEGKTYTFDKAAYLDKDEVKDGIAETRLELFINSPNKKILRDTTDGKNWAWVIFNNVQERTDNVNNFTIRDSNGDGKFDERFGADVSFFLPDYLKKQ